MIVISVMHNKVVKSISDCYIWQVVIVLILYTCFNIILSPFDTNDYDISVMNNMVMKIKNDCGGNRVGSNKIYLF